MASPVPSPFEPEHETSRLVDRVFDLAYELLDHEQDLPKRDRSPEALAQELGLELGTRGSTLESVARKLSKIPRVIMEEVPFCGLWGAPVRKS